MPGKSHGWRSLVGCSPWGRGELDTTGRLHFHFSLSCIGEGNGNPLQCSCLENHRDIGAWWASVYGVAQSLPQLKRLSSSSSLNHSSVQSSCSVVSDSLRPHGLQHSRLPCPSPTPRAWLNSCAPSRRCHPTTSSYVVPVSSCSVFPSIRVFSSESFLGIRWPKYWSFSINITPSNKHAGLLYFGWTG